MRAELHHGAPERSRPARGRSTGTRRRRACTTGTAPPDPPPPRRRAPSLRRRDSFLPIGSVRARLPASGTVTSHRPRAQAGTWALSVLSRRSRRTYPSGSDGDQFAPASSGSWWPSTPAHLDDAGGRGGKGSHDVSPPAWEGPTFSGIAGAQGPTRWRAGGSSRSLPRPEGARGQGAR
jgi:hypothetical protein